VVSSGLVVLVNGLMGLMAKKMLNDFLGEWVSNDEYRRSILFQNRIWECWDDLTRLV